MQRAKSAGRWRRSQAYVGPGNNWSYTINTPEQIHKYMLLCPFVNLTWILCVAVYEGPVEIALSVVFPTSFAFQYLSGVDNINGLMDFVAGRFQCIVIHNLWSIWCIMSWTCTWLWFNCEVPGVLCPELALHDKEVGRTRRHARVCCNNFQSYIAMQIWRSSRFKPCKSFYAFLAFQHFSWTYLDNASMTVLQM